MEKIEDWLAVFANKQQEDEARALGKEKWEMTLAVMRDAEDADHARETGSP